ncbi:hypothetical protein SC1083_1733 [Aggregatibacter actinomycetemcomitans serotype e str. SC1083]|uniref:Uncharacterized protein n=1 Tax=Aggregatibacter actinomycetemcomitans serotype e str. SC1083 TaxID=907488 RepID=G4AA60_AGGAC|nr:hypothetical protein SC1083_1733 [Aggregatibacter actinomycetemcomitans serotype e str. SC1083]
MLKQKNQPVLFPDFSAGFFQFFDPDHKKVRSFFTAFYFRA